MSMPFDATLKDLVRDAPADMLSTFDRPPVGALTLLNVDLSTVTSPCCAVHAIFPQFSPSRPANSLGFCSGRSVLAL